MNWASSELHSYYVRNPIHEMKRQAIVYQRILANYTYDKELVSRLYKELPKLDS